MHDDPIPYGYCHCGCGEKTTIAQVTDRRYGRVRGEPVRYRPHHYGRIAVRWVAEDRGHTTPCLIWQGGLMRGGYGQSGRGPIRATHRQAWIAVHGPIPEGLCVLHACDVPACGNVDHLFLGTNADNTADMIRKGRHRYHHAKKLTDAEVRAIRAAHGIEGKVLAARYGVSRALISMIRTGKTRTSVQ